MNTKQWLCAAALGLASTPLFAFDINAGISGSWFDPTQSGHGFAVEYFESPGGCEDGCLVVYWFTFTPEGEPLFLLGVGGVDGNRAEMDLLHFSGMQFGSFAPSPPPGEAEWGTLELEFFDCDSGHAAYDSGFQSGTGTPFGTGEFDIERLASVGALSCNRAGRLQAMPDHPAGGVWSGGAFSPDFGDDDEQVERRNLMAVVLDSGEAFLFMFEPAVVYRGVLSGDGVNVAGELDAFAGFPDKLPDGQPSGRSQVGLAGAAMLDTIAQRAGRGRAGDFLEGHFDGAGLGDDLRLGYQPASGRESRMERIARCWLPQANGGDLTSAPFRVGQDGAFDVTFNNGCRLEATVGDDLAHWNVYSMAGRISECEFAGDYDGIATVRDLVSEGDDAQLQFALENGEYSLNGSGILMADIQCQ